MKHVVLMKSVPGAGKTTLAKELILEHYAKNGDKVGTASADFYWLRPDGLYDWNPKNVGKAHTWCQKQFQWFLAENYELVIVDNTNLSAKEREPYILLAEKYGYTVEVREPETEWRYNAEECAKRNTHNVPLETIQRMLIKLKQDKEDESWQILNQ